MWVTTKYHAAIYFAVTKTWRRFFLISRRLHRYSDNRRWAGGSRRSQRRKLPWTTWRGRIRWSRIRWQVGSCTNITWLLVLVAGPRTNQNPEHEAGRAAGGAPDQRGHGGERHLLPQRQTVRGEVVMYHKDYTICSKYKHLCQGFLSSDLIKVACQSICSPWTYLALMRKNICQTDNFCTNRRTHFLRIVYKKERNE